MPTNAYDSVSREKLWVALKDYGVSGKLLVAVQSLYEDGWARVRVGGSHHGFRLRVE